VNLAVKSDYRQSMQIRTGPMLEASCPYSTDTKDVYRRAAIYTDKILKGAEPADFPVAPPMKFEFVVNLKTAKQIGPTIPPNVLVRVDRVMR
jgi:putative ABC transport system substrate-binding protein